MSAENDPVTFDASDNKHHAAREQAEAALREADPDRREAKLDAALRADPDAVADVLSEADGAALPEDLAPQDDEELAAMSRTMQPHADAPSRAGLTEDGAAGGSGADGETR